MPDTATMNLTHYPHRLLLAVTGLSPQVVTETLYALHQQGDPLPTAVHLLSTTEGAERARLTLLTDQWFARLCQDYQLPAIAFDNSNIHILEDPHNQPMDDIRTVADNQAAADNISEWVRRLTADDHTSLHVSIAGGRKTMGFYAGYALSLFGRQQDRLSHVLVSPPYESHPQFYYPTPYPHIIYAAGQSSKPLDTQKARVTLADIPFVRLRHGLPELILAGKSSFSQTVNSAQNHLGPAHVQIDLQRHTLVLAGKQLLVPPAELAFYSWIARRKLHSQTSLKCPCEGAPEVAYADGYLNEYQQIDQTDAAKERTAKTLAQGMDKKFFEQRKSRINHKLKAELGYHAEAYLIQTIASRPNARFELGLESFQIEFI